MSHFVWPTGGLGNGQDYMARCLSGWSFSIHDRPQPGCRGPSCTQAWDLQHDSKWSMLPHHMQQSLCFWLRSSKFKVISEVTQHSSTASSSDRQTTSRQGKTLAAVHCVAVGHMSTTVRVVFTKRELYRPTDVCIKSQPLTLGCRRCSDFPKLTLILRARCRHRRRNRGGPGGPGPLTFLFEGAQYDCAPHFWKMPPHFWVKSNALFSELISF